MTEASNPNPPLATPPPAPLLPPEPAVVAQPVGSVVPAAPAGSGAPAAPAQLARRVVGGFDPGTRRQTIVVAVILAALFFGTQVIDEALPAAAAPGQIATAPGDAVPIGSGWRITPLDGWVASTHDKGDGIRIEKGVVVIDLYAEPYSSASLLAKDYLDQALKANATQFTASDVGAATEPGGNAARFTYQGIFQEADGAIEGQVTAIVSGGSGVVADAWSNQGDLGGALGDVEQMLTTIEAGQ